MADKVKAPKTKAPSGPKFKPMPVLNMRMSYRK